MISLRSHGGKYKNREENYIIIIEAISTSNTMFPATAKVSDLEDASPFRRIDVRKSYNGKIKDLKSLKSHL